MYPLPADTTIADGIYKTLELPQPEPDAKRPYVAINMVSTLDGKASIAGTTRDIGSRVDRRTMRNLRAHVDAVMIGAGTLRAERLSLADQVAIFLTKSGELPLQNLVGDPPEKILVFTGEHTDICHKSISADTCSPVIVERVSKTGEGRLDVSRTLQLLKDEYRISRLLVEGGPSLNHELLSNGLADELFLTVSPILAGGNRTELLNILEGPQLPSETARLTSLKSVYLAGSELFLRYSLG